MRYFFAVIVSLSLLGSVSAFGQGYIYPTDPVTGQPDYGRPPIGYIQPQPTYQQPAIPYPSSRINELIATGGGYQPPSDFGAAQERAQRIRALELQNRLLEQELRRRQGR